MSDVYGITPAFDNDAGNAIYFLINTKYVGTVNLVSGSVNSFFKKIIKLKHTAHAVTVKKLTGPL